MPKCLLFLPTFLNFHGKKSLECLFSVNNLYILNGANNLSLVSNDFKLTCFALDVRQLFQAIPSH